MNLPLFFTKLIQSLSLGTLLCPATQVHGGLMHTMYRLSTSTGDYAVKRLNPSVMKRPEAVGNFAQANALECILEEHHIPILPALCFNGKKMQEIDGQFFYVYAWYAGSVLKGKDITATHCQKISEALYSIHQIHKAEKPFAPSPIDIHWERYIALAKQHNSPVHDLLLKGRSALYDSQRKGNQAARHVPPIEAICHNDMDCKNVLWLGGTFKIIDLECLAYANPYLELFELALCWSGHEERSMNLEHFAAFLKGYFKYTPSAAVDWNAIYDSNCGRLAWLEYNVKRALLLECSSPEEQQMGMEQVQLTLLQIQYYRDIKPQILRCLSTLFPVQG